MIALRVKSGFTLIEVMIALLVFTVGILATLSLQTTSINANALARGTTEGAALAADMVETLRTLDYQTDDNLTDGTHTPAAEGRYSVEYTIERDAVIDNTMLMSITIRWTEKGTPKSLTFDYIKPDTI